MPYHTQRYLESHICILYHTSSCETHHILTCATLCGVLPHAVLYCCMVYQTLYVAEVVGTVMIKRHKIVNSIFLISTDIIVVVTTGKKRRIERTRPEHFTDALDGVIQRRYREMFVFDWYGVESA